MLIFGDDNGSCSLYDMTLAEYTEAREKCDEAEENDGDFDEVWGELIESRRIKIDTHEHGYVPDYVTKLAEIYGFETESN